MQFESIKRHKIMKVQLVVITIMMGSLLCSCSKNNIDVSQKNQRVASMTGTWVLTHLGNVKYISKSTKKPASITIDTNAKTITGYSGCNQMTGSIVSLSGSSLKFGPIAATKRMCDNSKKESTFLQAFDKIEKYGTEGKQLYFLNSDNVRILTFEKVNAQK